MQWLTDDDSREEWHDRGQVWEIIVWLALLAGVLVLIWWTL